MTKNPCFNCKPPKRHPACHDKCHEYKRWLEEFHRIQSNRNKGADADTVLSSQKDRIKKLQSERYYQKRK